MNMSERIQAQIVEAYRLMAEAKYYPAAPSDGLGNITGQIDVEEEADRYAENWWREEDSRSFWIGCCNGTTRIETILAVEAARLMCGGHDANKYALRLLKTAVQLLEKQAAAEPPAIPVPAKRPDKSALRANSKRIRFEIFKRDHFTCTYCGARAAPGIELEIDHIVPLAKGGLDEESNLTTACHKCNRGKRDVPLETN